MSRSADKLFSFLDTQECFFVAMGVIRPDFIKMPAWTQEMAYNEYLTVTEETKLQFKDAGAISSEDLSRAIWHPASVDRYYGEAVASVKLAQGITQHRDSLQTAQDLDNLFVQQFRYFSTDIDEHTKQYCIDIDCALPFLTATFDDDGRTAALNIYQYPVNLETGEVAQEQLPKDQQVQLKPTPKQLGYAKKLAEANNVDLPFFSTRRAIGAFIHKYAPNMKERLADAQVEAVQREESELHQSSPSQSAER